MQPEKKLEDIISLAKRRGFVYQGSEIYGGLAGTWDYGPLGVELKNNLKDLWWRRFVQERDDMYGLDAAILMPAKVWEASGHTSTFADPLVEDLKTKKPYRADHLLEDAGVDTKGMTIEAMDAAIKEKGVKSPDGNPLGDVKTFNMLFPVGMGAVNDSNALAYLRGETAQGIFVNFKNVVDSFHPKFPFGIGQIGKAFRNEIAPRNFIFRLRELEQMEVEYFVKPADWERAFEEWRQIMWDWTAEIGLPKENVHELEVEGEDLAHYSKRTIDFEFDYPFGRKELYGLAYRTDYDLKAHEEGSKANLKYSDTDGEEPTLAHVIEPSLGVDRTILAVLVSAYTEDEMNGEKRTYLKFPKIIAPVKAAVFPLLKNKPELVAKAREVYQMLKKETPQVMWDDNGNIGKRYRRQDEIGTPYCITVDFGTLGEEDVSQKDTVTIRDRDTGAQERISISELASRIRS